MLPQRRLPLFRPASLLALIALWLILIVGSWAGRTEPGETGLLRLSDVSGTLSGTWAIPATTLARRFDRVTTETLAGIAERLGDDLGLVADGQVCKVRISPKALESGYARFALDTDCPAGAARIDAHIAPEPGPATDYRTMVSWTRGEITRHAIATTDAACVAFEAGTHQQDGIGAILAALGTRVPAAPERVHSER